MTRESHGRLTVTRPQILRSAFILFVLLPLVLSAQQQRKETSRHESPLKPDILPFSDSTVRRDLRQPSTAASARPYLKDTVVSEDASAIATYAPARLKYAVGATPRDIAPSSSQKRAGLSSPLNARSLQDWEVEDFVLLATVDGTIHARDRKTGAARWALEVDRAMVETTYHRQNHSVGTDSRPEDDFLWIVEPNRDGSLYIYNPGPDPGLHELGLTVRKLVEELAPWSGDDPPVLYTAEKKNTLYLVDAGSGRILKMFSAGGVSVNGEDTCRRVSGLELPDDDACGFSGTLTLGRTEYTVGISSGITGDPICTLRYSEWGPNNRDSDLQDQYASTLDQKYVYSRHDGSIFGFDHAQKDERRRLYTQKFSSPVARVFDVARPAGSESVNAPLVILPQPVGPTDRDDGSSHFLDREGRIFVNCTESGSWYAMSEHTYPLVTGGASPAQCYNPEWLQTIPTWDESNPAQKRRTLVGVHHITGYGSGTRIVRGPTISGPKEESASGGPPGTAGDPTIMTTTSGLAIGNSRLLGYAAQNAIDIGIILPILIFSLFVYVNRRQFAKIIRRTFDVEKIPGVRQALMSPPPSPVLSSVAFDSKSLPVGEGVEGELEEALSLTAVSTKSIEDREQSVETDLKNGQVRFGEGLMENPTAGQADNRIPSSSPTGPLTGQQGAPPKKKKTHRGQRGGAGRKKTPRKDSLKEAENEMAKVARIVEEVKAIGKRPGLESDGTQVIGVEPNEMTDVSGVFQVNNLVVTEEVLGYGSHGTIVYRGAFEGRDVAVKRMLLEFYDVASHEVSLLQESDDHPNVIRYFCRQESRGFLYIALELCPASLQDVVEKPHAFEELATASLRDLPNVLYQIAAGVRYLHSLKIVHRDLKPQNILVAAPKRLRNDPHAILPPRLLISDFGLCKKLDGDQSSFRATTAHAAGTSGWRAPELLVDDDPTTAPAEITHSNGGGTNPDASDTAIIDTLSNRRATRAIDIFSLGCVFFYILSRGNHPFGERYMREANIIKGIYNLDQLQVLADYGYEATALIERMLDHNPRRRPDAATVMMHPFFWSPSKRLNFLVDVSDHFEWEERDPPSPDLSILESTAETVIGPSLDFLRKLDRLFLDTLGKQRKYNGNRMLDLLRALRNKKNHYQDMPDGVKRLVGVLPHGYLQYWVGRFPMLLLQCYYVIMHCRLQDKDRFRVYFTLPATEVSG